MTDLWKKLKQQIDKGCVEGCTTLLGAMTDDERRRLWPDLKELVDEYRNYWRWHTTDKQKAIGEAIGVSMLLVATVKELLKLDHDQYVFRFLRVEKAIPIMQQHPRVEYASLVEYTMKFRSGSWRDLYALIEAGLVKKPDTPEYYLEAINLYAPVGDKRRDNEAFYEKLKKDQDFRDSDLWVILSMEGDTDHALGARSRWDSDWKGVLIRLVNEGVIPRDRFIKTLLESISRDFAPARGKWFLDALNELPPTESELLAHEADFIGFLGSSIPQTVSFAIDQVVRIHTLKPIDTIRLLSALEPVMTARQKSVVNAAIRMLTEAIKTSPALRTKILKCVAVGFFHESPEIHEKIIKLLEKEAKHLKPDEMKELILPYTDLVAPALRSRLGQWVSVVDAVETEERLPTKRIPQLVRQIQTIEELVEQAAYQFENPDDPILMEQVLDGFSRLGKTILSGHESLIIPIKKRVLKHNQQHPESQKNRRKMEYFYSALFELDIFGAEGTVDDDRQQSYANWRRIKSEKVRGTPEELFRLRVENLGKRIREGQTRPLLGFPSSEDGRISCSDFLLRLRTHSHELCKYEFMIALMRLSRDRRDSLSELPHLLEGDYRAGLNYATGVSNECPCDKDIWMAAHLARIHVPDNLELSQEYAQFLPFNGSSPVDVPGSFVQDVINHLKSNDLTAQRWLHSDYLEFKRRMMSCFSYANFQNLQDWTMHSNQWNPQWMATLYPDGSELYFANVSAVG